MRDLLGFLLVLTVIFFLVGEWRGWYLGVPGQTPVFVYKKDQVAQSARRTINTSAYPVDISGRVRNGKVQVEVYYQDVGSFQASAGARRERRIFNQEYAKGQPVVVKRTFEEGKGMYTIRMTFDDATGLFRLDVPTAAEL